MRDVAYVIEEERGKVDGKTPINEEVFQARGVPRVVMMMSGFCKSYLALTKSRADNCPMFMVFIGLSSSHFISPDFM